VRTPYEALKQVSHVDTKHGPVGAGLIFTVRRHVAWIFLFFLPKHEVHAGCVTEIVRIVVIVVR
jgi:hypothetical protein